MAELTRLVKFFPAYNRMAEGYGRHGVDINFVLKGPLGAISLRIFTDWFLPEDQKELFYRRSTFFRAPSGAETSYHALSRVDEHDSCCEHCDWLDGRPCFSATSFSFADTLIDKFLAEGGRGDLEGSGGMVHGEAGGPALMHYHDPDRPRSAGGLPQFLPPGWGIIPMWEVRPASHDPQAEALPPQLIEVSAWFLTTPTSASRRSYETYHLDALWQSWMDDPERVATECFGYSGPRAAEPPGVSGAPSLEDLDL